MKKLANRVKEVIVHAGVFHADDAITTAMVRHLWPEVKVTRTFNLAGYDTEANMFETGILVADVGRGRYDHHQDDVAKRADGHKRAACGLVFDELKDQLFPTKESADLFEQSYIMPIEDADNGVCMNPLSLAVHALNPNWDSEETADECFLKAVDMLQGILESEIERVNSEIRAEETVKAAFEESDGKVVILPRFMPWQTLLVPTSALYVVFPSQRGGYNIQAVPTKVECFDMKQPLPEEWLTEKPEGCKFIHQNRFLAEFTTEDQAVSMARALCG